MGHTKDSVLAHDEAASGLVHDSVIDAIGHTPLVRLNRVSAGLAPTILVKLEFLNPGGSVKDRAAREMILAAERDGHLSPGGVVVEGTSGNTGIGLSIIAAARGYSSVVVVPDKTSAEKTALLRALGAQVVVTPGGRPVGHPEHVRSVAERITAETPGAWLAGQYDNPANPAAHYRTTGPEIWNQTGGNVTHFVAGVGTGGTITGTGEYLKEVSDGRVRVLAPDPQTSVYSGGDGSAYYIESIGHYLHPDTVEDLWPQSYRPTVVDEFIGVSDREAIDTARSLLALEGLLVGGSGALAVAGALRAAQHLGPDDVVVVVIPDSGRNYLSKYFDDNWCARWGFAASRTPGESTLRDSVFGGSAPNGSTGGYRGLPTTATVAQARALAADLPTIPIHLPRSSERVVGAEIVGSVAVTALDGLPDSTPLATILGPVPALAGIDESTRAVAERAADSAIVVVLADGYAVATAPTGSLLHR
ncbi:PLP-dependent cysteine synthase family protein [Gordonia sp. DT30]|uniref:PLP-dependent cysteine synthase family protein n=1 Tax=Gordonia sp. DT30 TaxID=3416546 RepID=UPI003CFB05BD